MVRFMQVRAGVGSDLGWWEQRWDQIWVGGSRGVVRFMQVRAGVRSDLGWREQKWGQILDGGSRSQVIFAVVGGEVFSSLYGGSRSGVSLGWWERSGVRFGMMGAEV